MTLIGSAWRRKLVPRTCHRALSMLSCICHQNPSRTNHGHCGISHQTIEMPFPTPTEITIEATKTLIHTFNDPLPSMPFAHQPFNRKQATRTIADIFKPYGSPELPTHVIEPELPGPLPTTSRINQDLPHPPAPRVATPEPRCRSPRVSPTLIEEEPRYRQPRHHDSHQQSRRKC
jgi:hypothetical protein